MTAAGHFRKLVHPGQEQASGGLPGVPEQINSPFDVPEVLVNRQSFYFFWGLSSAKYKSRTQRAAAVAPAPPPPSRGPGDGLLRRKGKVSQPAFSLETNQAAEGTVSNCWLWLEEVWVWFLCFGGFVVF